MSLGSDQKQTSGDGAMDQRFVERHVATASVMGTMAIILLLAFAGSLFADRLSASLGHGIGHAAVALPVVALAVLAVKVWPRPRDVAPGRVARVIVVMGLAGLATGQLLEVLGARVDQPNAHGIEALAHTAGQIVTVLSLPVLLAGGLMTLIAAARARVVPIWLVVLTSLVATGLVLFMLLGGPIRGSGSP